MRLDFLTVGSAPEGAASGPVARSPMESGARAAGASFEVRQGWNVAVGYPSRSAGARESVVWADVSHLGKLELQAGPEAMAAIVGAGGGPGGLELGSATRAAGVWWLPITSSRTLVVGDGARVAGVGERLQATVSARAEPASVADVTTVFAALTLLGPLAREVFARFCAIDLRPARTPIAALRPGSIARQPGIILREDAERYLFLFGWAVGEYMWTVVEDAARHLGGGPVGIDALESLPPALESLPPAREEADARA